MAQTRATHLNHYFGTDHGFEPERSIAGNIIYKRATPQNDVERIVVKHSILLPGAVATNRDDEIDEEEDILNKLWGSEHNIRLLSIVRNRYHRAARWNEPINRSLQNPPPLLPWGLQINPRVYGNTLNFSFFVMEYLPRGTGEELLERCQELEIASISEPLLWYFFLCLTRACVGIAYPPNLGNHNPPAVLRETLPVAGRRATRISHNDLHLGNIMFGDYDPRDTQPRCHRAAPILKVREPETIISNDSLLRTYRLSILAFLIRIPLRRWLSARIYFK
ncbi:hypothetical protein F4824DRAFT_53405 [Ustulina deusta]|nr:hypothetical protein F4824DRAFT_53405 [Ustulina deusta]